MKLCDDAKNFYKWFSVQAMALAIALQGAWLFLSDEQRAIFPHWTAQAITVFVLVLGFVGRLVNQEPKVPPQ